MSWRIQTIKVARLLPSKQGRDYDSQDHKYRNPKIPDKLFNRLADVHRSVSSKNNWPKAYKDLDLLVESAFELALALRSCKTEYKWAQKVSPASIKDADVDRIEGYNTGAKGPKGRIVDVLFGPVYKIVDSRPVLLCAGTVLCS